MRRDHDLGQGALAAGLGALARKRVVPFVAGLACAWLAVAPARAQTVDLGRVANGMLGMLAWTVVPETTAAGITVGGGAGSGQDTLTFVQIGVGERVSPELPLYLELFVGLASFNPDYVVGTTQGAAQIGGRWSSAATTLGIGWEVPLYPEIVLRPIVNLAFGQVTTESRFSPILPGGNSSGRILEDDDLFAFGYGGSLMLDWERKRPGYEADIELRWTEIQLVSIDGTRDYDDASARAAAASAWSRLRVPTGLQALDRPLRAVFELAHTEFLGDQAEIGFRRLTQLGLGAEFDFGATDAPLERARIVGRFLVGSESVGASVGFGVSF